MKNQAKICYITAKAPFGKSEMFIINEMNALKRINQKLIIIPRDNDHRIYYKEAYNLTNNLLEIPIVRLDIILVLIKEIILSSKTRTIIKNIFTNSKKISILFKNLIFLPKAIFLANILKNYNIAHIHAHWGSTSSTIAYIISELTGIPWNFTLHRWDIYENNLLLLKTKSAKFVRCISQKGKDDFLKIVGQEFAEKTIVIHMGVNVPDLDWRIIENRIKKWDNKKIFKIVMVASLVPVKGHIYLIEAIEKLLDYGFNKFHLYIYGTGVLKDKLNNQIMQRKLENFITLEGHIDNNSLINSYYNGEFDIFILSSINIKPNIHEGIPVSIMEAMAYGIPVIASNSGSINELIPVNSQLLVKERSSEAIATAILYLLKNKDIAYKNVINNYNQIYRNFNLLFIAKDLLNKMTGEE